MAVGLVFLGSYVVESGVCGLRVVVPKRLDFLSTASGRSLTTLCGHA